MYNFLVLQWYLHVVQLLKFTVINQKGLKHLLKGKSHALLSAPPSQFWDPWFSPEPQCLMSLSYIETFKTFLLNPPFTDYCL